MSWLQILGTLILLLDAEASNLIPRRRLPVIGSGFANVNLKTCLCVDAPDELIPAQCDTVVPSDPAQLSLKPFDCVPTANVPNEDEWTDELYNAVGQQLTGLYTLAGQPCDLDGAATEKCPVRLRAFFQIVCPSNQMRDGKCVVSESVTVHYSMRQEVKITGNMPFRPVVVTQPVPIPISRIIALTRTTFTCPDKPVFDAAGAPVMINGVQKMATQIVLGNDNFGNPTCGIDPKAAQVDQLQEKLCDMEIQAVRQNGGVTTVCPPERAISNVLLVNGNHSCQDCLDRHGTLRDITTGGLRTLPAITAENINQFNRQYFCGFDAGYCMAGYNPYQNWTRTVARTCTGTTTASADWPCTTGTSCSKSVTTGAHEAHFENRAPETAPIASAHAYPTVINFTPVCLCDYDRYPNASTCTATIAVIGCY